MENHPRGEKSFISREALTLPPSLIKRNRNASCNFNHIKLINKTLLNKLKKISNGTDSDTSDFSRSSSSSNLTSALVSSKSDSNLRNKAVQNLVFNELVKVVLIPSRQEYKAHGLELSLWWTNTDYFQFQQEARSEITLCATYENLTFTQARTKLYQPDPNEADPYNSKLTISQSISEMSMTHYDDDDYYSTSDDMTRSISPPSDDENDGIIRFYQHSPQPSMSSLYQCDSPTRNNKNETRKIIDRISYTSFECEDDNDNSNNNTTHTNTSAGNTDASNSSSNDDSKRKKDNSTEFSTVTNPSSKSKSNNKNDTNHDDFNVCVLSSEFQELTTSSSYPDTYLERLRKRNVTNFFGHMNTPSLTVCSVFALTVVAVVAHFY